MNKRTQLDVGIVVWASFLAACLATMVFFAFIDPLLIGNDDAPPRWARDRMTGYATGFFFFWLICALASAFTAFMVETRRADSDDAQS
jgi:Na+-driven multidrug efflux pump